MKLYFWLFKRANQHAIIFWTWRKVAGIIAAWKHVRRGNRRQAKVWMKNVLGLDSTRGKGRQMNSIENV